MVYILNFNWKTYIFKTIYLLGDKSRLYSFNIFKKIFNIYLDGYNNLSYNIKKNGENQVLKKLSEFDIETVFDVGSNIGEWSLNAANIFQNANIYSFELAKPTFKKLKEKTKESRQIQCYNIGLSDKEAEIEYNFYKNNSGITTMIMDYNIHDENDIEKMIGITKTGDGFCNKKNIQHIDFLKIDVEGAENKVLEGFKKQINKNNIDIIQFEYGLINIYTGFLLKDFYDFLNSRGYLVGKIYPEGVKFKEYAPQDEDFRGPNYIAVLENKRKYIDKLNI